MLTSAKDICDSHRYVDELETGSQKGTIVDSMRFLSDISIFVLHGFYLRSNTKDAVVCCVCEMFVLNWYDKIVR